MEAQHVPKVWLVMVSWKGGYVFFSFMSRNKNGIRREKHIRKRNLYM